MLWTSTLRDFIQKHINDDTSSLLLSARKYPDIDVPFAVDQIEARKRLKNKLHEWYANPDIITGGRIPAEQCSSEQTARYKRSIIEGESLCDMTGGMGVDFWYMTEGMTKAIYTERQSHLCEAARHNFSVLDDGAHPSIEIRNGDGRDMPIPTVDVIYLDPARRATDGSRVYAIEDCEPNIIEWQDELLAHAKSVVTKVSPMVDITDALRKLRNVAEVHVVAVKNECKEVLFVQKAEKADSDVTVHCVDFLSAKRFDYSFILSDETSVSVSEIGRYLYEPDVTLMKAQAFATLCSCYAIAQLDYDTRLMTSSELVADFPGRIFVIDETIPFSSKTLKQLRKIIPQANIATRNFIISADELRKRTGIRDGGDVYLFGAKVNGLGDTLLKCSKI